MIRYRRLHHRFVDDMPEALEPGHLYVSMRYATAIHLCCCGCGREVVTPLAPAQWRMTFDGESISLHPSVGSWSLPCRSHYFIRSGQVVEAPAWSEEEVSWGQARDRQARAAYYDSVAVPQAPPAHKDKVQPPSKGWIGRLAQFLFR
jgi:hypothetical protein